MKKKIHAGFLVGLCTLLLAVGESCASEPNTQNLSLPDPSRYVMMGDCAVRAITPPVVPKTQTEAIIVGSTLDCIWEKESTRGANMYGDYRNGKPMAYGHFQIWISKHPVTYECAMDFECSAKYTLEQIEKGNGHLWTSYKVCK